MAIGKSFSAEPKKEKKERTMWQKLVRGFWITLAILVTIFVIGIVSLSNAGPSDEEDLTDNQEYVFQVTHGTSTYTYYCSGYTRNIINGSFILIDYEGKPTAEVVITGRLPVVVHVSFAALRVGACTRRHGHPSET